MFINFFNLLLFYIAIKPWLYYLKKCIRFYIMLDNIIDLIIIN